MKLYDYDGRPLVADLSDPLLERLRALHGEPCRDRRAPAKDGVVAEKNREVIDETNAEAGRGRVVAVPFRPLGAHFRMGAGD
jgi:hypothetical protein